MHFSGKQLRNVEPEMLCLLKSGKCIRQQALQGFKTNVEPVDDQVMDPPHLCCNVCKISCKCSNWNSDDNPFEAPLANTMHECLDDVQN